MKRPFMDCKCPQCRAAGRYAAEAAAELHYGPTSAHRKENRDPLSDDEALDEAGYAMHGNAGRYEGLTDDEGNADERLDANGCLRHHNADAWDSEGDDGLDEGDDEDNLGEDDELDDPDDEDNLGEDDELDDPDDEDDLSEDDELDDPDDEDDLSEDDELDDPDDEEAITENFEFVLDVGQFYAELDDEHDDFDDGEHNEDDEFDGEAEYDDDELEDDDGLDVDDGLGDDRDEPNDEEGLAGGAGFDDRTLDGRQGSFDFITRNHPCVFVRRIRVWKDKDGNDDMPAGAQQALCEAVVTAAFWSHQVRAAFQHVYKHRKHRRRVKRAWRETANGAFAYWFGSRWTGRIPLLTVNRRLKKIAKYFRKGLRFVIIKEQSSWRSYVCTTKHGGNAAYALSPVVYICPRFFEGSRTRQARTLIHELTHRVIQSGTIAGTLLSPTIGLKALSAFISFGHPVIGGRRVRSNSDARQARALARRRPFAARRSPVNFARLYQEIGTRINTRGLEG